MVKMDVVVDTRNKRTRAQILADRMLIAEKLLAGNGVTEITEIINSIRPYNLSRGQISYDVKAVEREWVQHYLKDVNTMKAKELARIDRIEREAWLAWEKSKQALSVTEKEQVENEQSDKSDSVYQKHRKVRAKKVETERDADEKFMNIVQWCVEQRCKILGINAPQRYDINWRKQAEAAGYNPDEMVDELASQFVSAAMKGKK